MLAMTRKQEASPFRKILRELMVRRQLSVRQAAKIAGVPASTLSNWRTGATPEDYLALRRLADHLGVTLGYLLTGQPDLPLASSVGDEGYEALVFEGYARILVQSKINPATSNEA